MSRQYYPNKKKLNYKNSCGGHYFDVNSAGANLLGIISWEAGFYSKVLWEKYGNKETPFKINAKESREAAKKIKALDEKTRQALYQENKDLFSGSLKDFSDFIDEWSRFLQICGGYEAM